MYGLLRFAAVSAVFLLWFIGGISLSKANSPPLVMKGGTAFPVNSDSIVLEKETINIHYGKAEHSVEVIFHFYNTGTETDLQIGFPNLANYEVSINNFRAFSFPDKAEYSVEKKPGGVMPGLDQYIYNSMYAWTMHFKAEERKSLLVTYSYYNTSMSENDGGFADYILETGALWKEKIDSIDVFVDFPEKAASHEIFASPENYYYNGEGIEWHFKNIEPDFNLNIAYQRLPEVLLRDWMYKPFQKERDASDYQWDDKIFAVDLFERWNLDEEPLHSGSSGSDPVKEMEKVLQNCLLVKNEIYARHGAILENEWDAFFRQFPWYQPREDFSESEFNNVEKLNLELIRTYLKYIKPDADRESFINSLDALFNLYGDAFFRYYPVYKREQTKENIQRIIDQLIEWWDHNQPVNLGSLDPGPLNYSHEGLIAVENLSQEKTYPWFVTKNGYQLLNTDSNRVLIKKDNKMYEVYQGIVAPDEIHDQMDKLPQSHGMMVDFYFYEWDFIKKWCSEIRHPLTGERVNPLDTMLILPESGEKYILTGLSGYEKILAWSENGSIIAYKAQTGRNKYVELFDLENKQLKRYQLPEDTNPQKLIVSNAGQCFIECCNEIYKLSGDKDEFASVFPGQIVAFNNLDNFLVYTSENRISRYYIDKNEHRTLDALPETIWRVEKQDSNNYLLYCHPDYYYIYNYSSAKTYRYPHMNGVTVRKFSPSGQNVLLQKDYNEPVTVITGNTNEKMYFQISEPGQIDWHSESELVVNFADPENPDNRIEHRYDIHTGKRTDESADTPVPETSEPGITPTPVNSSQTEESTAETINSVPQEGQTKVFLYILISLGIAFLLFFAYRIIFSKAK